MVDGRKEKGMLMVTELARGSTWELTQEPVGDSEDRLYLRLHTEYGTINVTTFTHSDCNAWVLLEIHRQYMKKEGCDDGQ